MSVEVENQYIGHATAYAYAKSKGYTGTEEEFAELMADYASVGQAAAQSAQHAAQSAQQAAQSAQTAESAKQEILSATISVTPIVSDGNLTFNAAIEGGN